MIQVVSNSEMHELDSKAINHYGIPGIVLMENAGRNTAELIIEKCDELETESVLIFAGKGNNGGDGFVIARFLDNFGMDVIIYLLAEPAELQGDAHTNFQVCQKSGISIKHLHDINDINMPNRSFIIVDALLGTGVRGPARGIYADVINWINEQPAFVLSVDIPSGLSGDSAAVTGPVVSADVTCTMGLLKTSMFFYPARSFCGDIQQIDIGFPADLLEKLSSSVFAVDESDIFFKDPDPSLHKHTAGRVLLLGGSTGMTGALVLAAKAASLAGAGLVIAAVADSLNPVLENKLTEQLSLPLPEEEPGIISDAAWDLIKAKIDWCHAFLVGPGSGRERQNLVIIKKAVEYAHEQNKKIIIDADGLFMLSTENSLLKKLNDNCVITPHHGEFIRLDNSAEDLIGSQPWKVLQDFVTRHRVIVNLKGAPSVVGHTGEGLFINTTGNPGLAKGGSGDILAGLITGLCSSGFSALNASCYANFIHGRAADKAAERWGLRSFSMENLLQQIKLVFKEYY